VKQVDIPEQMQRAIARRLQPNASARNKLFTRDGDPSLLEMAEAAKVLETQRSAIQLPICRLLLK